MEGNVWILCILWGFFFCSGKHAFTHRTVAQPLSHGPLNNLKSVYHMISEAFEVYAKNALVLENKQTDFHVNQHDNKLSLKFFSFILVPAVLSMNRGTLLPPGKSKPMVDSMKPIVGKITGKLLF